MQWVQLDEPGLTVDRDIPNAKIAELARKTYTALAVETNRPAILVTSPYGNLRENLPALLDTGIEALHLDLVSTLYDAEALTAFKDSGVTLVAGAINGRNIWRADLRALLHALQNINGGAVAVALLNLAAAMCRTDLDLEDPADVPVDGLAFADQKVAEIVTLARGHCRR